MTPSACSRCAISGIVETDGLPTAPGAEERRAHQARGCVPHAGPERAAIARKKACGLKEDKSFALAAASLRQAMQEMPEISELSKHIMIEETDTGLNIEIVDQEGRSMFPDGAKEPFERTRRIIQKLAVPLKALPNRVSVTGHTAASRVPPRPGYGPWELSADRANAVRQILEDEGLPAFAYVHGRRQSRQPAAVSRRSAYRGQSPRDHHADAGGPAAAGRFQAVGRVPPNRRAAIALPHAH